jgi:hypothetical protein
LDAGDEEESHIAANSDEVLRLRGLALALLWIGIENNGKERHAPLFFENAERLATIRQIGAIESENFA